MAYDLADVVPLAVTITDANGAPADGGTVTLTITLPDGTTATPAVSHPGTGQYQVDYPPTMPGRHVAAWVCTGTNASGYTDVFDVRPATPAYLVSLADAKKQLKMTSTVDDEDVRNVIEAATEVIERHLDLVVVRRQIVERRDLGTPRGVASPDVLQQFVLSRKPVLSLTSIVAADGDTTWDTANMSVSEAGVVRVLSGDVVWGPVVVTYQAGMAIVPANYTKAAKVIVQHLWQTRRGSSGSPQPGGMDTSGLGFTGFGYAIPNAALELLGPSVSGIA